MKRILDPLKPIGGFGTTLVQFGKFTALTSVAFLAVTIALVSVQVGKAVQGVGDRIETVADHLDATTDAATAVVAGLNRPCGSVGTVSQGELDITPAVRCGTLAQLNKTMVAASDVLKHADALTAKESETIDAAVTPLVTRAGTALDNVNRATADLHPLLTEATARVSDLGPVEANAAVMVADADATIRDPDIGKTINALEQTSEQLAVTGRETAATMGSVQAIAKDGQDEVHSLTHPKPLVSIADWTLKVVHALGGFF